MIKSVKRIIDGFETTLCDREIIFCREYLIDGNASRAGIAAGYSPHSVRSTCSRILSGDERITAFLAFLNARRSRKLDISAEKVLQELAKIAFHNVADLMEYVNGNVLFKDLKNCAFPEIIKSIEIKEELKDGVRIGQIAKINIHDKLKALEMLGKHFALFTENINLQNDGKEFEANRQIVNININHRKRAAELTDKEITPLEVLNEVSNDDRYKDLF